MERDAVNGDSLTCRLREDRREEDRRMELAMGRLLQLGVLLASALVLAGGVLYVRMYAWTTTHYKTFVSEPAELRHPLGLVRLATHGNEAAIIQLGILVLIATPIARVVFAIVGFAMEKDRLYIGISALVLCVLLFGLVHGL
jgi:uncharacterized membrane protein